MATLYQQRRYSDATPATQIRMVALLRYFRSSRSASTCYYSATGRPLAGLLLLPYFLWVGFAVGLNSAIVRLN